LVDVERQVAHWRLGAQEDWDAGEALLNLGKFRHALFFLHLSLEKALKARVCSETGDVAPRVHNLVRLSELAGLTPDSEQLDALADMGAFNMEGRYPEMLGPPPTLEEARSYARRAREVLEWLMKTS
jgi:HEPN domain-containing protein